MPSTSGATFPFDQVGNAQILLLEGHIGVDQQDHDIGEADRFEGVADR